MLVILRGMHGCEGISYTYDPPKQCPHPLHQEVGHFASGASGASGTSGASWSTWSSPEADRKQPEANYYKTNFHEAPEAPEAPEANFFLPDVYYPYRPNIEQIGL